MAESFASSSTQTGCGVRPPTASPTRVYVHTLGCKVNQVDSAGIRSALIRGGQELVDEPDSADVVVVNTCTVTADSDKKCRKAIRRFARMSQGPRVVVTGCMAALDTGELRTLHENVMVVADRELAVDSVAGSDLQGASTSPEELQPSVAQSRTRVQLKVQDGCDNSCSYCIVPAARGRSRSSSLEGVRSQAQELVDSGVREIVLTGINLGSYHDRSSELVDLVGSVANTGISRLRLSSVEPQYVSDSLLELLGSTECFCRHLHIPLQSGSDSVLAAMGRPYTAVEYLTLLERVRHHMPGVALTTDVIVGFPGETEQDAEETRAVCREAGFSKIHVFRYSVRPNTIAAERPRKVPPETARARSAELTILARELKQEFVHELVGRSVELLVERTGSDADGAWAEGTSREYLRCRVRYTAAVPGDIMPVRLVGDAGDVVLTERLEGV